MWRFCTGERLQRSKPRGKVFVLYFAQAMHIFPATEIDKQPARVEFIESLMAPGEVVTLTSLPNVGKTFVALELARAVANGENFLGLRTEGESLGSALYVYFEGSPTDRILALRCAGRSLGGLWLAQGRVALNYMLRRGHPSQWHLPGKDALREMCRYVQEHEPGRPLRLLVVDTVSASMVGDENSSEAVSSYLDVVRDILTAFPQAGALLVHHAGWQDGETPKERERGSSAFRGNVDSALYLREEWGQGDEDGNQLLRMEWKKLREGRIPEDKYMFRRMIHLGFTNKWGHPGTSCVIDHDTRSELERARSKWYHDRGQIEHLVERVVEAIAPGDISSEADLRLRVHIGRERLHKAVKLAEERGFLSRKKGSAWAVAKPYEADFSWCFQKSPQDLF